MKKYFVVITALLLAVLCDQATNATICNVQNSLFLREFHSFTCPMGDNDGIDEPEFNKIQVYHLVWPGPAYAGKNPIDVDVIGFGVTRPVILNSVQYCPNCFPEFGEEINMDRFWAKRVRDAVGVSGGIGTPKSCQYRDAVREFHPQSPVCACQATGQPPCVANKTCGPGCQWNEAHCRWDNCGGGGSPIIIDLNNDGYDLTNAANGVLFDLEALGTRKQWSWTARRSDDAFLALDRDGDGRITNGKELFGNFTDQPTTEEPNGFIALAMFDSNNDRWIDKDDAVYRRLLLWVDSNHDGVNQRSELHSLDWGGVDGIGLDYRVSKRSDQYGNNFKYRAPVRGRDLGRWAWDVFLVAQ